jgi:predicted transcriptional regulator
VNKLIVNGKIIGRDDTDGILLLNVKDILTIPHKQVSEISSKNLITLEPQMDIKEAAWILSNNGIDGAPVIQNQQLIGILTLIDITRAIANKEENLQIKKLMSKYIITIPKETMISEAMEIMNKNKIGRLIITNEKKEPVGIITKTDILNQITGLKYLNTH